MLRVARLQIVPNPLECAGPDVHILRAQVANPSRLRLVALGRFVQAERLADRFPPCMFFKEAWAPDPNRVEPHARPRKGHSLPCLRPGDVV